MSLQMRHLPVVVVVVLEQNSAENLRLDPKVTDILQLHIPVQNHYTFFSGLTDIQEFLKVQVIITMRTIISIC